jgi:putative oxidoreductase
MKVVALLSRILMGLVLFAAGLGTFLTKTPPVVPGFAGQFNNIAYGSHFVLFLAAAQFVMGVLLLVNRYVPLALIMVAAFIYNSFAFHITMLPSVIFAPVILSALWLAVAWPYRSLFAPLFVAKPKVR